MHMKGTSSHLTVDTIDTRRLQESSKRHKMFSCCVLIVFAGLQLVLAANNATLGAYNPQLNNTIPNGSGPVIPYNGSDGVPPLYIGSPAPQQLPALRSRSHAIYRAVCPN